MKKICIIGLGYMGLPTALLFAKQGFFVVGQDIVKSKIDQLNNSILPFEEEGLEALYHDSKNNFTPVHELTHELAQDIDTYIISVPTPFTLDKKCDLSCVQSATSYVAKFLKKGDLVILESTVSPGTTLNVVKPLLNASGIHFPDYNLAYVSEKAIPGNTLYEMVHNDRIVGGVDAISTLRTVKLYSHFVKGTIHQTDSISAEMTKLVENTYRDINIAFANDLAKICEFYEVNVWRIIELANKHPRVNVHSPGPGVGGHCIAIDPWFLTEQMSSAIITIARKINDDMPSYVFEKINSLVKRHNLNNPNIGILGVAYKKNVDDSRETPAEPIIKYCKNVGWNVFIHDPLVKDFEYSLTEDVTSVISKADIIVIVTDHDYYKSVDLSKKIVFDTRNMHISAKEYHILGAK